MLIGEDVLVKLLFFFHAYFNIGKGFLRMIMEKMFRSADIQSPHERIMFVLSEMFLLQKYCLSFQTECPHFCASLVNCRITSRKKNWKRNKVWPVHFDNYHNINSTLHPSPRVFLY